MTGFLCVVVCILLCFHSAVCQFGFYPNQQDERYGYQNYHQQPRRIHTLSGRLHFGPNHNNHRFRFPDRRPISTGQDTQYNYNQYGYYDQYGRPIQNQYDYPNFTPQYNQWNNVNFQPDTQTNSARNNNYDGLIIIEETINKEDNNTQTKDTVNNDNTNPEDSKNANGDVNFPDVSKEPPGDEKVSSSTVIPESFGNRNGEISSLDALQALTPAPVVANSGLTFAPLSNFGKPKPFEVTNAHITVGEQTTLPALTPAAVQAVNRDFSFQTQGLFSPVCTTVDGGHGSCITVFECAVYAKLLFEARTDASAAQTLKKAHCGFDGNTPKVCCPSRGFEPSPTLEPTAAPTPAPTAAPAPTPGGKTAGPEQYTAVLPDPPECGLSNASFSRIVNGVRAKLGDFPWMALLGYKSKKDPNTSWLCGGSLVTHRHVLTAAHCIHNHEEELYVVRLGELDLERTDEGATPADVLITNKIKHEDYNSKAYTNDIAVLVLEANVPFTDLIRPICLPKTEQLRSLTFENYMPIVAGWGKTEFRGPSSSYLQALQLPVVSNSDCADAYSMYKLQKIDEKVLCAGYKAGGKDACQGDSGGPLMQPIWDNKEFVTYFYQTGVVSFGKECALANFPGVYSRVTYFMPWIEKKIAETAR